MAYSDESVETGKGNFGEKIVYDWIKASKDERFDGVSLFQPFGGCGHYCDGLGIEWTTGEIKFYWDVKSKMKLMKYNRTGYDAKNHHLYMKAAKNSGKPFYVFFVDAHPDEERVYFQEVTVLDGDRQKMWVKNGDDLRTFHMSLMEHARDLKRTEVKAIMKDDPQNEKNLEYGKTVTKVMDNHKNYYTKY